MLTFAKTPHGSIQIRLSYLAAARATYAYRQSSKASWIHPLKNLRRLAVVFAGDQPVPDKLPEKKMPTEIALSPPYRAGQRQIYKKAQRDKLAAMKEARRVHAIDLLKARVVTARAITSKTRCARPPRPDIRSEHAVLMLIPSSC